jgi:hypothetical protein
MEKPDVKVTKDCDEVIELPLSAPARDGTNIGHGEGGKEAFVAAAP